MAGNGAPLATGRIAELEAQMLNKFNSIFESVTCFEYTQATGRIAELEAQIRERDALLRTWEAQVADKAKAAGAKAEVEGAEKKPKAQAGRKAGQEDGGGSASAPQYTLANCVTSHCKR